jgi:hypothetical protein
MHVILGDHEIHPISQSTSISSLEYFPMVDESAGYLCHANIISSTTSLYTGIKIKGKKY